VPGDSLQAGPFLETPVREFARDLFADIEAEPERHAGPYRLLHEIGRCGMSVVDLAERADGQYEQQGTVNEGTKVSTGMPGKRPPAPPRGPEGYSTSRSAWIVGSKPKRCAASLSRRSIRA
jgi:hypothetical protein